MTDRNVDCLYDAVRDIQEDHHVYFDNDCDDDDDDDHNGIILALLPQYKWQEVRNASRHVPGND